MRKTFKTKDGLVTIEGEFTEEPKQKPKTIEDFWREVSSYNFGSLHSPEANLAYAKKGLSELKPSIINCSDLELAAFYIAAAWVQIQNKASA